MTGLADAFLRDVLENPADDTPRLVFADWLEDNGEPERAEFIRVQVELARMPESQRQARRGYDLRMRQYQSRSGCLSAVLNGLRDEWETNVDQRGLHRSVFLSDGQKKARIVLCRGFVDEIALTLADLMDHAATLFSAHPITTVRLTDRVPTDLQDTWHAWLSQNSLEAAWAADRQDGLPQCLWASLASASPARAHGPWKEFRTLKDAFDALSAACVHYGRNLAGLPTLPPC